MTDKIKDGGPAFPVSTTQSPYTDFGNYGHQDGNTTWQFGGMTLRDYFAAKAMASMLTHSVGDDWPEHKNVAMHAYNMADEMLAARESK